jgi:hypothetical protein
MEALYSTQNRPANRQEGFVIVTKPPFALFLETVLI